MSVKPALIMIDMQNGFLNESSPLFIQAANLLDMRNVGAQLMTSVEYMRGDEIIDNLDYVRSRMKAEQKEEKGSDEHL